MLRLSSIALLLQAVFVELPVAHAWEIEDKKWIRASSENYVIYSRMSERRTVDLLKHIEVFRTLTGVKPGSDQIPTLIIVAGGESEFIELGGDKGFAGYFIPRLRSNYILLLNTRSMSQSGIIMHEYGHSLLNQVSSSVYPAWYQEGYAEYLSSVKVRKDKAEVFGFPEHLERYAFRDNWLPARKLISPPTRDRMTKSELEMFYFQSWALVHFLISREGGAAKTRESLGRYGRAMNQGGNKIAAFEEAFDMKVDGLNERLRRYVRKECCRFSIFSWGRAFDASGFESTRAGRGEVAISLARLSRTLGERELASRLYSVAAEYSEYRDEALAGGGTIADEAGDREAAAAAFAQVGDSSHIAILDLAYHYERMINRTTSLDEIGAIQAKLSAAIEQLDEAGYRTPEYLLLAARHDHSDRSLTLVEEAYLALPSSIEAQTALVNAYISKRLYRDAITFARILRGRNFENPEFVRSLDETIHTLERQLDTIESFSD